MKPRTLFIVGILALVAFAFYRLWAGSRTPDPLKQHLAEQNDNSRRGRLVGIINEIIRPAVQTLSNRGPLDGAVVTPWGDYENAQDTLFRPTGLIWN